MSIPSLQRESKADRSQRRELETQPPLGRGNTFFLKHKNVRNIVVAAENLIRNVFTISEQRENEKKCFSRLRTRSDILDHIS